MNIDFSPPGIRGLVWKKYASSLEWRCNGRDGVSNHQPLFTQPFIQRRSTKISMFRVTAFCAENSPVTGEFPAQMASNAENVSMSASSSNPQLPSSAWHVKGHLTSSIDDKMHYVYTVLYWLKRAYDWISICIYICIYIAVENFPYCHLLWLINISQGFIAELWFAVKFLPPTCKTSGMEDYNQYMWMHVFIEKELRKLICTDKTYDLCLNVFTIHQQ